METLAVLTVPQIGAFLKHPIVSKIGFPNQKSKSDTEIFTTQDWEEKE